MSDEGSGEEDAADDGDDDSAGSGTGSDGAGQEGSGDALVVLVLGSPEVDRGTGNTVFSLSAEEEVICVCVCARFVFCSVFFVVLLVYFAVFKGIFVFMGAVRVCVCAFCSPYVRTYICGRTREHG